MSKSRFMKLAIFVMLMPSSAAAFKGFGKDGKTAEVKLIELPVGGAEAAKANKTKIEGWTDANSDAREAASAIRCIDSLRDSPVDSNSADKLAEIAGLANKIKEKIYAIHVTTATTTGNAKREAAGKLVTAATQATQAGSREAIAEVYRLLEVLTQVEDRTEIEAEIKKVKPKKASVVDAAIAALVDEKERAALDEQIKKLNEDIVVLYNAENMKEVNSAYAAARLKRGDAERILSAEVPKYLDKIYEEQNCDDSNVLCLDTEGLPIKSDLLPATLAAGKKIKVVVITEVDNEDSFFVSFSEIERVNVLINPDKPATGEQTEQVTDPCELISEEEFGYKVAVAENFTIPKSIGVVEVSIDFKRIPKAKGEKPVTASYGAYIEHGKYYIDLGLFVPFAIAGKRKVVARQIGQERYLAVETDLSVTAGLAMNVFPGGRRRGEFTPWSNLRCPAEAKGIALRNCRRRARARPWAELLGLQIGADLDVRDPIDQFYFGLVLEPVTGVTLSSGVAVMKIDHLKAGLSEGQLVASDDDMVARQLYGVRPFLSFGLSLDLVQAIRAARERLAAQKP